MKIHEDNVIQMPSSHNQRGLGCHRSFPYAGIRIVYDNRIVPFIREIHSILFDATVGLCHFCYSTSLGQCHCIVTW